MSRRTVVVLTLWASGVSGKADSRPAIVSFQAGVYKRLCNNFTGSCSAFCRVQGWVSDGYCCQERSRSVSKQQIPARNSGIAVSENKWKERGSNRFKLDQKINRKKRRQLPRICLFKEHCSHYNTTLTPIPNHPKPIPHSSHTHSQYNSWDPLLQNTSATTQSESSSHLSPANANNRSVSSLYPTVLFKRCYPSLA